MDFPIFCCARRSSLKTLEIEPEFGARAKEVTEPQLPCHR
jgi:hypothetical protein